MSKFNTISKRQQTKDYPNKLCRIPSHIRNFLKELGWKVDRGVTEEIAKGNKRILIVKRPWGIEFQFAIGPNAEWPKGIGAMSTIPNFNIGKQQLKDIIAYLKTNASYIKPYEPGQAICLIS